MSESEKFLDRWSRRKRDGAEASAPAGAKKADAAPPPPEAKEEAPFDPASLPPIGSITAESDIRAFLRPGVPPELSRAALRQAWSTDPAIRDFVGLVENGWDFNDPTAMHGFGPIEASEVARLLAGVIGDPRHEIAAPRPVGAAEESAQILKPTGISEPTSQLSQDRLVPEPELAVTAEKFAQRDDGNAASQNNLDDGEDLPPSRPRGHGGALPK
jgi:hypothetical protein